MADPIGTAGTALGVVSLGLQIYKEVKQYVDDFNSRDERVAKTLARLEQLKETLGVISAAIQALQSQHRTPADAVMTCLRPCVVEMDAFRQKVQKFEPSQQIGVKGKMKELKKKLEFPFQVQNLEETDQSLKYIIDQLSLAIQALGLHSHTAIATKVDVLDGSIGSQTDILRRIDVGLHANEKATVSNTTHLASLSSSVQPLEAKFEALELVARDGLGRLEHQAYTHHSATTSQLEGLGETSMEMTTEVLSIVRCLYERSLLTDRESAGKHLVESFASKPSLLRDTHKFILEGGEGVGGSSLSLQGDVHDRIASEQTVAPGELRLCDCSSWCKVKQNTLRRYPFGFFSREETRSKHYPGCPLYNDVTVQRRRAFGVTYRGLQRLFSAAVSVSVSFDYGAGGVSISPVLRYNPVINEYESPPFLMITLFMSKYDCCRDDSMKRWVAMRCVEWINVVYGRRLASPRDVTKNGLTLIDHMTDVLPFNSRRPNEGDLVLSNLFDFGVTTTIPWVSTLNITPDNWSSKTLKLLLQRATEFEDQWGVSSINFLRLGNLITQSSELRAVVEPELDPLCLALLHKDLDGLTRALARTSNRRAPPRSDKLLKPLVKLAVRWPAGLRHILTTKPDYFDAGELKMIFSQMLYVFDFEGVGSNCGGNDHCHGFEFVSVLLENGCPLTLEIIHILFGWGNIPQSIRKTVLQHIASWREKLRESLRTCLPDFWQDQSTAFGPHCIPDYEAPFLVKKLQVAGQDPYKLFNLQPDDFRLGCSLDGRGTIYHIISKKHNAQLAFDMGFRDVDRLSGGVTPLSKITSPYGCPIDYYEWLISHGADYTKELAWDTEKERQGPSATKTPRYLILHWIFRYGWHAYMTSPKIYDKIRHISSIIQSPRYSGLPHLNCYDGCSCACSSSGRGCSPFTIHLNQAIEYERVDSTYDALINAVHMFDTNSKGMGESSALVESLIRCITFKRLDIRHTCCTSIDDLDAWQNDIFADYGNDFNELREEDKLRVHQLDTLVAEFMDLYTDGHFTLQDFIRGPWKETMAGLEAEADMTWTAEEKDALLSIGVIPRDTPTCDVAHESNDKRRITSPDFSDPEVWNQHFEIIANGGGLYGNARCV